MNRRYTTAEYEAACRLLRQYFTHPAITTDVIVGFPGETEEEFAETERFLRKIHFYEMHIFKYSKREGTRAAVMEDQIPEEVKTARSAKLLALADQMSVEFRDYYLGREEEVLFEEPYSCEGRQLYVGYTREYVKVAAESDVPLSNEMRTGRIAGRINEELYYIL
jgi:threonylcarbamoyladenosine tRNA methylthiotransferase MtaB